MKGNMSMDITLNREALLSAALDVERIAPQHSPVELLRCAYLVTEEGKLTVAAGDVECALERQVTCDIRRNGYAAVNAKLLARMLRLLEGETVSILASEKKTIEIKSGAAEYRIPALDASEYPRMELPFPEDTVAVTGIPRMVKRTAFAASEEESAKPALKCVHLAFTEDGLTAVGCDGYRVASAKGKSGPAASVSILIPAASLEKLARLVSDRDTLQVGVAGREVVFRKDGFLFSARQIDGNYFDTDRLFQMVCGSFTVLTDAEAMREMIGSVTVVVGSQNRFYLSFQGNRLQASCESESGASSGALEVVVLSGSPSGTFWYNPRMLMECLKAQSGTMLLEAAQNGALIMKTDELTCVQLAVRAPHSTGKEAACSRKRAEDQTEAA